MRHILKIACTVTALWGFIILIGADAVLRIEKDVPGATITTTSDSLWWALNACSVGGSDIGPITAGGRFVGAVLVILGYACFTINIGIVTVLMNRFLHWLEGNRLL